MPTAAYIGPTWFLHQTAHDERGRASDDVTSGTATHSARELSTDQRYAYGGAAYESTGLGTFLFLALRKKWERAHEREKSTITYRFSVPVVVTAHAFGRHHIRFGAFFKRLDLFRSHGFVTAILISLFAITSVLTVTVLLIDLTEGWYIYVRRV